MTAPVLHAVVTGAPPAANVGVLVELAQRAGWQVCVIATPNARRFLNVPALTEETGFPVVSEYRQPGDPVTVPRADALAVAPATGNTLAKWAAGISDTYALGLLVEAVALRAPVVAVPFSNWAHLSHPAIVEAVGRLRSWDVSVLTGDDICPPHPPGPSGPYAATFPWDALWDELRTRVAPTRPGPGVPALEVQNP
ncbi:flavoprotein [Streptomyces parvus]|uniref:Flavoprotein n=1 Tax=Streptomyces parvus TaxID=66428 RepID=A0A5D4JEW0_9ACTN|nr:flavoprotein [Streptomyces parvus]TYR62720.1 flavoprotein [Streptomyces parvus]